MKAIKRWIKKLMESQEKIAETEMKQLQSQIETITCDKYVEPSKNGKCLKKCFIWEIAIDHFQFVAARCAVYSYWPSDAQRLIDENERFLNKWGFNSQLPIKRNVRVNVGNYAKWKNDLEMRIFSFAALHMNLNVFVGFFFCTFPLQN